MKTRLALLAAADGRGPTFTLLRVSDPAGKAWLAGGYHPQRWHPAGTGTVNNALPACLTGGR
jgi:hypothetical protein